MRSRICFLTGRQRSIERTSRTSRVDADVACSEFCQDSDVDGLVVKAVKDLGNYGGIGWNISRIGLIRSGS